MNAAMAIASGALIPKPDIQSPRRIGTPQRIGSSKLTLRKKKVVGI